MRFALRQRWLSRGGIAAAAMVLSATQVSGQARPRPAAPPVKATLVTSVEGITEYSLPNGLRVLLFPDPSKATVTVNITYLVGSAQEGYGETGMAHLLEHMVFKGSKNHVDMVPEFSLALHEDYGTSVFNRMTVQMP